VDLVSCYRNVSRTIFCLTILFHPLLHQPADYIQGTVAFNDIVQMSFIQDPPRTIAGQNEIRQAVDLLLSAKRPLLVIGKGYVAVHLRRA
jgi:thiamine pyrophosphate-dependent acetolactate synthase large subunit-like protein